MSNSKNVAQKKENITIKEVRSMSERKYYQAYPSYDDSKKIKGLVMDIEGTKYYIDLKEPVVTEIKRGTKVLFTKKTFNVSVLPTQKKSSKVKNAL